MLMRKIFILILISASVALTACGNSSHIAAITGIITHSHRMVLPEGYVVTILIEDTTKVDAPAKKISEEVIKTQGEILPIPFAIEYDTHKINTDHTYSVRVVIEDSAGKMEYTNTTIVPVITNGGSTKNIVITVVLADG